MTRAYIKIIWAEASPMEHEDENKNDDENQEECNKQMVYTHNDNVSNTDLLKYDIQGEHGNRDQSNATTRSYIARTLTIRYKVIMLIVIKY